VSRYCASPISIVGISLWALCLVCALDHLPAIRCVMRTRVPAYEHIKQTGSTSQLARSQVFRYPPAHTACVAKRFDYAMSRRRTCAGPYDPNRRPAHQQGAARQCQHGRDRDQGDPTSRDDMRQVPAPAASQSGTAAWTVSCALSDAVCHPAPVRATSNCCDDI
jgi:hypothetical protein